MVCDGCSVLPKVNTISKAVVPNLGVADGKRQDQSCQVNGELEEMVGECKAHLVNSNPHEAPLTRSFQATSRQETLVGLLPL